MENKRNRNQMGEANLHERLKLIELITEQGRVLQDKRNHRGAGSLSFQLEDSDYGVHIARKGDGTLRHIRVMDTNGNTLKPKSVHALVKRLKGLPEPEEEPAEPAEDDTLQLTETLPGAVNREEREMLKPIIAQALENYRVLNKEKRAHFVDTMALFFATMPEKQHEFLAVCFQALHDSLKKAA